MKKLLRMEVGVAEIEHIGLNINSKFKSNHFKNRVKGGEIVSKDALRSIMMLKLRDEKKLLKELLKKKMEGRKEIEEKLKKNSRPTRNLIKEFREETARIRIEHREKYRVKIEHLKRKYRESKEDLVRKVPDEMEGLEDLRIFDHRKYNDIEMESYEVKVIGDVELTENELKVLKLHPKFAVLPRLCEGGLDLDEELANSKLRMTIVKELEEKKKLKDQEALQVFAQNSNDEVEKDEDKEIEADRNNGEGGPQKIKNTKKLASGVPQTNLTDIEEIEIEAKSRQVFDPVEKIFDDRKRRVTDLKECNRITLPKPLPANEEAKIEIRRDVHKRIYEKYRAENCNRFGDQKSNLSKAEMEGLKSLEKRIKKREIIVIKTDKSSRFAVCNEAAYLRMGRVHTSKDRVVEREELIKIEKILNSHCVAWGKMWQSGDNHEHRSRIINSKKTASENTADLYLLLKDHKEGEKTRPVVTGCTSNTLGMSNYTASIIEAVAASEEKPFEAISSEDMLAKTKDCNRRMADRREERERSRRCCCVSLGEQGAILGPLSPQVCEKIEIEEVKDLDNEGKPGDKIPNVGLGEQGADNGPLTPQVDKEKEEKEGFDSFGKPCEKCNVEENMVAKEEMCLIGCDVVALFPSLSSKRTGEIVRERVLKSKLKFEGFDFNHGRRYILLNKHLTGDLGSLRKTLPWRKKAGGNDPVMTGAAGTKIEEDIEDQWVFPRKELADDEKKEIIARCIEIGVRIVFENFCYKFGGETLKQKEGGPIGARVTMAVARLVMQAWAEAYLEILERSGLVVDMLAGYVDDVRQVSTVLKDGMRYDRESRAFMYSKEAEEEDIVKRKEGECTNQRMARVCQAAMCDIDEDLEFTVEAPEDFENERLPTLDFSLWLEDGFIIHTYYQKSMKTPYMW